MSIVTILLGSVFISSHVSALTYQDTISPEFTINESITVTVSSPDLRIDDLAIGQSNVSNTVDITVLTNNDFGYTLTSTAGNGTTYTNTNLINSADNTKTFTSLATTDSIADPANFESSKWGYSYSTDSQSTWSSYSGLPYYGNTGATLLAKSTKSSAGGDVVNFKIAAKSSSTQASGTYNNVINFVVTGNVSSFCDTHNCMQNIADWKDTELPNIGDETIAYDARDEKAYYVAKLPDDNIWMTQNLDYDIVDAGADIDSTNTDVPANWADAGNLTDTYTTNDTTWEWTTTAPESYDPGDLCWNGTLDENWETTIDTGTTSCSALTESPDHYHVGNYYNWTAAVAMNNSGSYTTGNTDVDQSICPAGWMLPKSGTTLTGSGSFYNLVNGRYTSGASGDIQDSPVYFVYGGYWYGSSDYVGSDGYYWSSVVRDATTAYGLGFSAGAGGILFPQYDGDRSYGDSVRCLAR